MSAPRVISLYSGAGGLDLGFTMAGYNPIFANDIDAVALASYEDWMKKARQELVHLRETSHRIVAADITRVADLPDEGDAEIVIGGPPCQGFSVAGKMNPNDPRSRHVWNFLGVVKRVQPRAFVMENVKALAVNKRWAGLKEELIAEAEKLGYATSLHVLNASHYSTPQARERMFLVGVRKPGEPMPAPTETSRASPPSLRDAIGSLPVWGEEGNNTLCTAKVTPAKKPVLRRSPFAGMLFNGQGRPMDLEKPGPTLPASMGGNRTPIIDQEQLTTGCESWVSNYHRQLLAGGRPVETVPPRLRRITVEEAAAIQTFPPQMYWHGPQSAKYRQIGNAVPPLLAYHVAMSLRSWLELSAFSPPAEFLGLSVPSMPGNEGPLPPRVEEESVGQLLGTG